MRPNLKTHGQRAQRLGNLRIVWKHPPVVGTFSTCEQCEKLKRAVGIPSSKVRPMREAEEGIWPKRTLPKGVQVGPKCVLKKSTPVRQAPTASVGKQMVNVNHNYRLGARQGGNRQAKLDSQRTCAKLSLGDAKVSVSLVPSWAPVGVDRKSSRPIARAPLNPR